MNFYVINCKEITKVLKRRKTKMFTMRLGRIHHHQKNINLIKFIHFYFIFFQYSEAL